MKNHFRTWGIIFVLPFFLVYVVFNLYPIVYTFYLSLTRFDGFQDPVWVGFRNYIDIMTNGPFWRSFLNTWAIWVPNVLMQLAVSILLAVLFTDIRIRIKGVRIFRALFFFPNLVTAASISLLVIVLLDYQSGAVNQILFGDDKSSYIYWMGNPGRNRFLVSIIQTWRWFGNSLIILIAGLQAVPRQYYESAEVDGASGFHRFIHITFPMILPIFIFIIITSLIGGMQMFDIPYILGTGAAIPQGSENARSMITMIYYMYNKAINYGQIGYGAAVTYVIFAQIMLFSFLYIKLMTGGGRSKK